MVNSGGEIEQFQHSNRNMDVKLKASKNVLQSQCRPMLSHELIEK